MLFLNKCVLVFILFLTICNTSYSTVFKELKIDGSKKISPEYLYNELNFNKINNLKQRVNAIRNKLDKTNFIEVYTINITNNKQINVHIKERKMIKNILFIGNKKVKSEDIKKSVSLNERKLFDEKEIDRDMDKIKEFYNNLGYLSVDISYNVEEIDNTYINLKINVIENAKTTIKKITFNGNDNIKSRELKDKIASKENSLITFGISKDFIKERLEYDKYLLNVLYKENGFLDFEINSINYKFSDDYKYVNINYNLYEGNKYRINDVIIRNEYGIDIDDKEIISSLQIKKNGYFNLSSLKNNIEKFNNKLRKKNLGFVSIVPDISKVANDRVNLIIFLQKNTISYIGKININGNVRTNENTIRDIVNISEGELINDDIIQEAKQNLTAYGFYKNIDIVQRPHGNKVDLDINLEESKFGSLGIGFGYSTLDKLNVNFNLEQKNLFGEIMSFDTSIILSKYRRNYSIGFGKPKLLNTKMFGGFNIYSNKNMYSKYDDSNMDFDEKYHGIDLYTKYKISSSISQKMYYTFMRKNNFNISDNYKNIIEKGNVSISLAGTSFSYDTRDDIFYPLEGIYATIDMSIAGLLGGDKEYYKTIIEIAKYLRIYKKLVFKTQLSGGIIRSFSGDDLYPGDGFYVGGSTLRGFKYGSAGLRVREYQTNSLDDGESIGGTKYFAFNNEFRFPLVSKNGMSVFGVIFYDLGVATGLEKNHKVDLNRIEDSDKIRSSCGLAVIFKTPVGNIGLEFSKVLSKEFYDKSEGFRVNIGTNF